MSFFIVYLNTSMIFTKMIRARVMQSQSGQLSHTRFELCGRHAGFVF